MSKKVDDLGEYDDEQVPPGLEFPFHLDIDNTAICDESNAILARYGATIETSVLLQEKRKIEFLIKLLNGRLIVQNDPHGKTHVYRRVTMNPKGGKLVGEYEEIK